MLSAARFIAEEQRLPNPEEAGVRYKALDEVEAKKMETPKEDSKHLVTFKTTAYECALRDLLKIMHYIFDLLVWILRILLLDSFTLLAKWL